MREVRIDETSIIMLAAGAVLLITRGTLLIAPAPIRVLYLRSLLEPLTVRLAGLLLAALTGFGIYAARADRGAAADNAEVLLWVFLVYVIIGKVLLAGPYSRGMKALWGSLSNIAMRLIGLIAAALGGALVYYGYLWG